MASVQLTDVIETKSYMDYRPDLDLNLLALWNSGVIANDAMFNDVAQGPERTAELIFWRDINMGVEPNHGSTQPVDAVPQKVSQDRFKVLKAHLNQGWSSYNLTRELTHGLDAMAHIKRRTATYWAIYRQLRLIAMMRGVINSNVNGNFAAGAPGVAGDMIVDVSTANATTAPASAFFNSDAFSEAVYTMGDRSNQLGAIIVHSAVHNTMQKEQLIEYVQDVDQRTSYETYRGRRIITDDATPFYEATPGSPELGYKYISIIFGQEAFGYGVGNPVVPVEVDSSPRTGHGAGGQELWERKTWLMHPFGFDNTGAVATANEGQQDLADLQDESNWIRVVPRKAVPIAYMITNG